MFGYVVASFEDITVDEKARYQAVYCGLCRSIEDRYGQISRACLNYDLTFFALVYNSLYEPQEESGSGRCVAHPLESREYSRSMYTDHAADLTIALAYHKCLDDWYDEKSLLAGGSRYLLEGPYQRAKKRIPKQCESIEQGLADIRVFEDSRESSLDAAAKRFGILMGDIFPVEQDIWTKDLWYFGAQLGRFIYAMDAAVDYADDEKSGSYNPFVLAKTPPVEMKALLTSLIGDTTEAFEKLPLVQDIHLMRSVLYAGVWQKFNTNYGTDLLEKESDE